MWQQHVQVPKIQGTGKDWRFPGEIPASPELAAVLPQAESLSLNSLTVRREREVAKVISRILNKDLFCIKVGFPACVSHLCASVLSLYRRVRFPCVQPASTPRPKVVCI